MADIFHKSCYMARSTGYKYRTLSTNTGDSKFRQSSIEDSKLNKKLKELKREICSRVHQEVDQMVDARDSIREKFTKIDAKINSMIELQQTVLDLRGNLHQAENAIAAMLDKVNKIEVAVAASEPFSLHSRKSSYRSQPPIIFEEKEQFESNITHI